MLNFLQKNADIGKIMGILVLKDINFETKYMFVYLSTKFQVSKSQITLPTTTAKRALKKPTQIRINSRIDKKR